MSIEEIHYIESTTVMFLRTAIYINILLDKNSLFEAQVKKNAIILEVMSRGHDKLQFPGNSNSSAS